jgi:cytochrome o ubiquinol oxidase operon protein cyoD
MSSSNNSHHDAHGHDHHDGASHGTMQSYMIGFVLSIILTAIPFWLVMGDVITDKTVTTLVIVAFAAVQIVVHMVYFLHMNTKSEGGWTFMSMVFTLIVVMIALVGSLWVMYNMNVNMMPTMTMDQLRNLP